MTPVNSDHHPLHQDFRRTAGTGTPATRKYKTSCRRFLVQQEDSWNIADRIIITASIHRNGSTNNTIESITKLNNQ
jgi:hypothetical protein